MGDDEQVSQRLSIIGNSANGKQKVKRVTLSEHHSCASAFFDVRVWDQEFEVRPLHIIPMNCGGAARPIHRSPPRSVEVRILHKRSRRKCQ